MGGGTVVAVIIECFIPVVLVEVDAPMLGDELISSISLPCIAATGTTGGFNVGITKVVGAEEDEEDEEEEEEEDDDDCFDELNVFDVLRMDTGIDMGAMATPSVVVLIAVESIVVVAVVVAVVVVVEEVVGDKVEAF